MQIKVFCCYAPEDEAFYTRLKTHLHILQNKQLITLLDQRTMLPGSERRRVIQTYIDNAQIILLLLSSDFIISDECYQFSLKRALERQRKRKAQILPVLLRPLLWQDTPLKRLQMLPHNQQPVAEWHHQEQALLQIAEEVRRVALQLQKPASSHTGEQLEKERATSSKPDGARQTVENAQMIRQGSPEIQATSMHSSARPVQPVQPSTSQIFQAPVQAAIAGNGNIIHLYAPAPVEDTLLVKGREDALRGYNALRRKEYATARQYLETAQRAFLEDLFPAEAAIIRYHLALAFLNGQRPFLLTRPAMQQLDQILKSALNLQSLHSYYYILGIAKYDFARNGLLQYKHEASQLLLKAKTIPVTPQDKANLKLLTVCQPRLVEDAKHW